MASKMPAAQDAKNVRITIGMAEQQQYQKPLQCEFCEASVSFINAFTRQVGDDIVAVEPFFRLHNGHKHSPTCRYNVLGQITVIAKESDGDVLAALQDNRYELRLLAVKKAVEQLRDQAKKKKNPDSELAGGTSEKIYVEAEKRLGAYINSAVRVLKVRAACLEHSEIEDVLQLVFDGIRLPWRDFYFEDDEYFRCFTQIKLATVHVPVAIRGAVREKKIVDGRKGKFAVLNLARPFRKAEQVDVLDAVCCSIWSADLNAFDSFKLEQEILAFGLWECKGINDSANKKQDSSIKTFRNHELSLWPVTKSQLCVAKN